MPKATNRACERKKTRHTHTFVSVQPTTFTACWGPQTTYEPTALGSTETAAEEGLPSEASPQSFSNYQKVP